MSDPTLLEKAGNPLAVREFEFLRPFWADPELETEFSRSFFFGQEETPRVRELLRGQEEYYQNYKQSNLDRLRGVGEFVTGLVHKDAEILDVGCGMGQLAYELERRGLLASGVDINETGVRLGQSILETLNTRVRIRCGDALNLPYEDDSFDAVISCDVIEHIPEQQQFLSEIQRVLRPGGIMVLHTDNDVRVQLGVWYRRLTGLLRFRDPREWKHAWAGLEGGHCALTTPASLLKLSRGLGFESATIQMCGSPVPAFGRVLAPKFILHAKKALGTSAS